MNTALWRRTLAEALGTFMLVLAGTGAMVMNEVTGGAVGHVGIALAFGLIVLTVIYAYGELSGAHINPAVTFGFAAARRFPWREVPAYWLGQCAGAVLASGVLALGWPETGLGATRPAPMLGLSGVWLAEALMTWWLMTVILGVSEGAREKGLVAGLVIGGTVALAALVGGPISGASMNPARSLGPAFALGDWSAFWVYVTAPVIGAWLAVLTCRGVAGTDCCQTTPLPVE